MAAVVRQSSRAVQHCGNCTVITSVSPGSHGDARGRSVEPADAGAAAATPARVGLLGRRRRVAGGHAQAGGDRPDLARRHAPVVRRAVGAAPARAVAARRQAAAADPVAADVLPQNVLSGTAFDGPVPRSGPPGACASTGTATGTSRCRRRTASPWLPSSPPAGRRTRRSLPGSWPASQREGNPASRGGSPVQARQRPRGLDLDGHRRAAEQVGGLGRQARSGRTPRPPHGPVCRVAGLVAGRSRPVAGLVAGRPASGRRWPAPRTATAVATTTRTW